MGWADRARCFRFLFFLSACWVISTSTEFEELPTFAFSLDLLGAFFFFPSLGYRFLVRVLSQRAFYLPREEWEWFFFFLFFLLIGVGWEQEWDRLPGRREGFHVAVFFAFLGEFFYEAPKWWQAFFHFHKNGSKWQVVAWGLCLGGGILFWKGWTAAEGFWIPFLQVSNPSSDWGVLTREWVRFWLELSGPPGSTFPQVLLSVWAGFFLRGCVPLLEGLWGDQAIDSHKLCYWLGIHFFLGAICLPLPFLNFLKFDFLNSQKFLFKEVRKDPRIRELEAWIQSLPRVKKRKILLLGFFSKLSSWERAIFLKLGLFFKEPEAPWEFPRDLALACPDARSQDAQQVWFLSFFLGTPKLYQVSCQKIDFLTRKEWAPRGNRGLEASFFSFFLKAGKNLHQKLLFSSDKIWNTLKQGGKLMGSFSLFLSQEETAATRSSE